jgi:hypothetical protein
VIRVLPHHRYVCIRHRYWIGPPDAGQRATHLDARLDDIVRAQRRHLRLRDRYGAAAAYDAVLTGFLICGHLWGDEPTTAVDAWYQWTARAQLLIPVGEEASEFSASRLFAATYPEAVNLAAVIASPTWRQLASGSVDEQQRFTEEVGLRLGRPDYQPPDSGDVIAHWMKFDSGRPPSRPDKLFPETREHGSRRLAKTSPQSHDRQDRSATWFQINRRGGSTILHHRHLRPVLIREWAPRMDGITATIHYSQTTLDVHSPTDQRSDWRIDQTAALENAVLT